MNYKDKIIIKITKIIPFSLVYVSGLFWMAFFLSAFGMEVEETSSLVPVHGMEVEEGNSASQPFKSIILDPDYHAQVLECVPEEVWGKIFNYLDEGRWSLKQMLPKCEIKLCPVPINDFIASGMVCENWRKVNLSLRRDRILTISEEKILKTSEDYEAIRYSGYETLCLFSESVLPEDISNLDCLKGIENVFFLPPKGNRAYMPLKAAKVLSERKYLNLDVMRNIGRLQSLKALVLNGNNLDVEDLKNITKLVNITHLDLTYNRVKKDFLLSLTVLKKMRVLKLINVGVVESFQGEFGRLLPNCIVTKVL